MIFEKKFKEQMRIDTKENNMHRGKSWLTPKEAGEILGMTGRNVTNLIKKGKIRADKDEDGRYFIEKSEFFRVYPDALEKENERNAKNSSEGSAVKLLEEKLNHMQELLSERKRQNEFLVEQLNNFTQEKKGLIESINAHTRLLEYKETQNKTLDTKDKPSELSEAKDGNFLNWRKLFKKK